jgi:hypothetical protein
MRALTAISCSERCCVLQGGNGTWLREPKHASPSTPTRARRAAPRIASVLRGCSLRGMFQAIGLWRREVRYLAREVPLDGTFNARGSRGN